MRTSPSLLRILLVQFVVDLSSFYGDGIESGRGKRFQRICGLRVNHANPKINKIAGIGNDEANRKGYQHAFSEQPQPSYVRHGLIFA